MSGMGSILPMPDMKQKYPDNVFDREKWGQMTFPTEKYGDIDIFVWNQLSYTVLTLVISN